MKKLRYILSGGGTGGHIYPAIAIADGLKKAQPEAEVLFVGALGKMEMTRVPQAGYPIQGLWIAGLSRKLSLKLIQFPVQVAFSLLKSAWILWRFKPKAVIGTGGFASGPLLKVAGWMGIPYFVQEQNAYAGKTNQWLAAGASSIFVAYPGMDKFFPAHKTVLTGNPVRASIQVGDQERAQGMAHWGLSPQKKTLLILGGSLGARKINQIIAAHLPLFAASEVQLLWQCGALYADQYTPMQQDGVVVLPFIDRMDWAYACADWIISRAGAGTVSELALVAKPVLLIPSPNVAEDHQTKNAQAMVDQGAALLLAERDSDRFAEVFTRWMADPEAAREMGLRLGQCAFTESTQNIVQHIIQQLHD
ncbi:MAG: undecaprenyldiphospho-muramoylpentapeptide beta-N-acetylglucosaminyltransferase [Bacteroidota bacterium]|nr:UDP-N-acetylglucosamine--N-acetylmuramyl-(pentapeptide) pyrophosphoryl-undecaprenol N-acetylglucosamine transferase [Flavobacteriaceae bacterium]